jgi:hypothetical protein
MDNIGSVGSICNLDEIINLIVRAYILMKLLNSHGKSRESV